MEDNKLTVQNAPRDLEQLKRVKRGALYRLALALNLWAGDPKAEEAFLLRNHEEQAQDLLAGFLAWDAQHGGGNGNGQAAPAQPAPQVMQPAPQQMQPMPMQPTPQVALSEPPPREPVTTSDPGTPVAAAKAAPPVSAQLISVLSDIKSRVENLNRVVDEEVAGAADLEELRQLVLGTSRTQQSLAMLMLLVAEQILEVPSKAVVKMVEAEIKKNTLEELFTEQAESEGKE